MGRFARQPIVADNPSAEERLQRANHEISRLRARNSTLEQTLENEVRARLEAGAMLASERLETRRLQKAVETHAASPGSTDSHGSELENAWTQVHRLQAALARNSHRWWHRGKRFRA